MSEEDLRKTQFGAVFFIFLFSTFFKQKIKYLAKPHRYKTVIAMSEQAKYRQDCTVCENLNGEVS